MAALRFQRLAHHGHTSAQDGADGEIDLRQLRPECVLGQGAFGVVWRVRHARTSKRFALKTLRKAHMSMQAEGSTMIKRERDIMSVLDHPCVIAAYSYRHDARYVYMLLDFLPGESLQALLDRQGHFELRAAVFSMACLCAALAYLHDEVRVAHRDLKPENLVIDRHGYVQVLDFGLSKVLDGPTLTVCGTPVYLAPEVLRGKGYSYASEWWSAGVLLYELLLSRTPFDAETKYQVVAKIMAKPRIISYPDGMEGSARDLVERLLVGVPSKRLGSGTGGSAAVCRHDFFASVSFEALAQRQVPPPWPMPHAGEPSVHDDDPEPPWLEFEPCVDEEYGA